jgi:hypothetical protein
MIDWKKFAAEHGGYMTAWKDGKLYIAGPELQCCYAIVAETPEKVAPCGYVEKIKDLDKMIEKARRNTGFIQLSHIIGDALEGYEQKRVECDCVGRDCYECEGEGRIEYRDGRGEIYDIECPVCDGTGDLGGGPVRDCLECDGLGYWMEWPKQTITYEGRHFGKDVLRVLSLLPGVQVALGAITTGMHYFVFDGGEGVFMGLVSPYEK